MQTDNVSPQSNDYTTILCMICNRFRATHKEKTDKFLTASILTHTYPIIRMLFYLRVCPKGHVILTCKACGEHRNEGEVISHVYWCRHGICKVSGITGVEIHDCRSHSLFININKLTSILPQLLCVKVDYNNVLDMIQHKCADILVHGRLWVDNDELWGIAMKLLEKTPKCILCKCTYDGFPSEEECIIHLDNCVGIGKLKGIYW